MDEARAMELADKVEECHAQSVFFPELQRFGFQARGARLTASKLSARQQEFAILR